MTPTQQVLRLLFVPIAMSLFLLAAQVAGGFDLRETQLTHIAMK